MCPVLLWLLKQATKVLELLLVGLILATKWTAPRAYRLTRRTAGAVHRWYVTRPVLLNRNQVAPAAAVTATTTAPTLADLSLKQEANAR